MGEVQRQRNRTKVNPRRKAKVKPRARAKEKVAFFGPKGGEAKGRLTLSGGGVPKGMDPSVDKKREKLVKYIRKLSVKPRTHKGALRAVGKVKNLPKDLGDRK